jgi:hypothetical protein
MSLLATEVTGLLLLGSLAQVDLYTRVSELHDYFLKDTYLVYSIDPQVLESRVRCYVRREGSDTGQDKSFLHTGAV